MLCRLDHYAAWNSPPFEPVIRDGYLYGRGAVDMKGSIAAMIDCSRTFYHAYPSFPGSIAILLTSDEEGPAIDGTRKVVEELIRRHENIKWCLVGEPSSLNKCRRHGSKRAAWIVICRSHYSRRTGSCGLPTSGEKSHSLIYSISR